MRVASSRLDIVNEADSLVQKTHQQADHFRKLKKKAMSLPVIGSIVGLSCRACPLRLLRRHLSQRERLWIFREASPLRPRLSPWERLCEKVKIGRAHV